MENVTKRRICNAYTDLLVIWKIVSLYFYSYFGIWNVVFTQNLLHFLSIKVSDVQMGNFLCLVGYYILYIFWKVIMPKTQI